MRRYDIIIIGAGISGMYQLHAARQLGMTACILEAASDVGGTWQANRYPGCRFDSESFSYGYSFSKEILQNWNWTELFAAQPETFRYLSYVADTLDLRRDISLDTRVISAAYDEQERGWTVTTDAGQEIRATFLITAVGVLSAPVVPPFPGKDSFRGRQFHTSDWPDGLDLTGKRVIVVGTGSTGVQVIQEAAKVARQLTVLQREASWCKPLRNRPIPPSEMDRIKASYDDVFRRCDKSVGAFVHHFDDRATFDVSDEARAILYEERYNLPGFALNLGNFHDIGTDERAARAVGDFLAGKIRERVADPKVADMLIPQDHLFGTRRVVMETGYFEVFQQANVELIDVKAVPIAAVTEHGVMVGDREIAADVIIYATGFDAIRGAFDRIDIRGVGGQRLIDKWANGPVTYLGLAGAGFPNLLTLVGPHSSGTFCNVPRCAEHNVEFVTGLLKHARDNDYDYVEASAIAERRWMDWIVAEAADLLVTKADSWFTGVNVNLPGRQQRQMLLYTGGQQSYRDYCAAVTAGGYDGFVFREANPLV